MQVLRKPNFWSKKMDTEMTANVTLNFLSYKCCGCTCRSVEMYPYGYAGVLHYGWFFWCPCWAMLRSGAKIKIACQKGIPGSDDIYC